MRKNDQSTGYLVPGTWYLNPIPGTWYLIPGTWYPVPGTWYLVLGTWYLVLGTWYLVLGTLVSVGYRILPPGQLRGYGATRLRGYEANFNIPATRLRGYGANLEIGERPTCIRGLVGDAHRQVAISNLSL